MITNNQTPNLKTKMKTKDQLSQENYGKNYNELPDDGAEQDYIMGLYEAKTLIFEGAGWEKAPSSDVGNCRIRTRLINNDGVVIYLEINGFETTRYTKRKFKMSGIPCHCFSGDCNEVTKWRKVEGMEFEYTASSLLSFVNERLNCSFNKLEVINDGSVEVHATDEPLCASCTLVEA